MLGTWLWLAGLGDARERVCWSTPTTGCDLFPHYPRPAPRGLPVSFPGHFTGISKSGIPKPTSTGWSKLPTNAVASSIYAYMLPNVSLLAETSWLSGTMQSHTDAIKENYRFGRTPHDRSEEVKSNEL